MKIVKENQNLMILKDKNILPYILGIILFLVGISNIFFVSGFSIGYSILVLFGLLIIFNGKVTTLKIDIINDYIELQQKSLIKKNDKSFKLHEIKEVKVLEKRRKSKKTYQLGFVLHDDTFFPLSVNSLSYSISVGIGKSRQEIFVPAKILGERIAKFLNVPFKKPSI